MRKEIGNKTERHIIIMIDHYCNTGWLKNGAPLSYDIEWIPYQNELIKKELLEVNAEGWTRISDKGTNYIERIFEIAFIEDTSDNTTYGSTHYEHK